MIPQAYVNEWRALIEIFSDPFLAESLVFRGGTALHKIFIQPAARYSEDIDLIQIKEGSIGPILEALRKQLNPWLGEPKWKLNEGRAVLIYRFESEIEPITNMRLKVEINTREHFAVLGFQQKFFEVNSSWFKQSTNIITFALEELLATKLRALYQRKKGRDLFDLVMAFKKFPSLNVEHSSRRCFGFHSGRPLC